MYSWIFLFYQKLQFRYLSLGLHKGLPSYKRSLNIQHLKTRNFLIVFYSWIRIHWPDQIRIQSGAETLLLSLCLALFVIRTVTGIATRKMRYTFMLVPTVGKIRLKDVSAFMYSWELNMIIDCEGICFWFWFWFDFWAATICPKKIERIVEKIKGRRLLSPLKWRVLKVFLRLHHFLYINCLMLPCFCIIKQYKKLCSKGLSRRNFNTDEPPGRLLYMVFTVLWIRRICLFGSLESGSVWESRSKEINHN